MDSKYNINDITPATIDTLLSDYPSVVPEKLSDLDKQRYDTIVSLVRSMGIPKFLTKEQVTTLVDWKLSHGKFRPSLKNLVQENTEYTVKDKTRRAFRVIEMDGVQPALKVLTELRGIGPATASLLLSIWDGRTLPFFSDELFRWCLYEPGKGKGWDRDIKYTAKEYQLLVDKIDDLRARLIKDFDRDVSAVEIERAAYVLGKRVSDAEGAQAAVPSKKRKAIASEDETTVPVSAPQKTPQTHPDPEPAATARVVKKVKTTAQKTKPKAPQTAAASRPGRKVKDVS